MATNPYTDGCAFIEGKFFRLDDHLKRFENSYTQLRMNPTMSLAQMREILNFRACNFNMFHEQKSNL